MHFVKITSIKPAGKQHVYDLSMKAGDDPSFVANGIIVHNSYASAESAVSTFLETQNSYRNHLTHSIFYSTLFPLIAVANNLYKDPSKKAPPNDIARYLLDSTNRANLMIPKVMWHKSLEAKGEENTYELLEQASEKGVPVPLKTWMAAAGLDPEALLKDLQEDIELRKKLEQFTGKDTSHEGEDIHDDNDYEHDMETASMRPTVQSLKGGGRTRKALLARDFGDNGDSYKIGKTGKKQWVHNSRTKQKEENARIAKIAARAAVDEVYRKELADRNMKQFGHTTIPGAGDLPMRGK